MQNNAELRNSKIKELELEAESQLVGIKIISIIMFSVDVCISDSV